MRPTLPAYYYVNFHAFSLKLRFQTSEVDVGSSRSWRAVAQVDALELEQKLVVVAVELEGKR